LRPPSGGTALAVKGRWGANIFLNFLTLKRNANNRARFVRKGKAFINSTTQLGKNFAVCKKNSAIRKWCRKGKSMSLSSKTVFTLERGEIAGRKEREGTKPEKNWGDRETSCKLLRG